MFLVGRGLTDFTHPTEWIGMRMDMTLREVHGPSSLFNDGLGGATFL